MNRNRRNAETYFLNIFIFLACLALSASYTGIIPPDPDNPGKCIYRGGLLEVGVNNGIAPCQRLTCNEDGSLFIEGCGKLSIENCNRGERIHTDKPYPECCILKYKCKSPDGTPEYKEVDVYAREAANKAENAT